MTINPYDGTEVILRGGLDQYTDNREGFYPIGTAGSARNSGSININRLTNRETNYDVIARQNFELGSDMSLVATGGWNLYDRTYSRGTLEVDGFLVNTDKLTSNVNTANEASEIGNSRLFIRSIRAYGVLSLDAFDQIFMNLSLARETHSTISDAYNYPAFDIAYQMTDMANGLTGGFISLSLIHI